MNRYQMREKLVSIGDDFWIKNAAGKKIFKVDGKALRVRDSYGVEIAPGQNDILILTATVAMDMMR